MGEELMNKLSEQVQVSVTSQLNHLVSWYAIIGIIVFVIPFIFAIIIVWLNYSGNKKRRQLQAEVYVKAIESGQPISRDLFVENKKKTNPLHTGIICIAVGIGISLFALLMIVLGGKGMSGESLSMFRLIGSLGIIPFFIGIAFVIIHFMERKKDGSEDAK